MISLSRSMHKEQEIGNSFSLTKLKRKDHVVDLGIRQSTTQKRNEMQINCSENVKWTEPALTICPSNKTL
jgi:hypothetical protein